MNRFNAGTPWDEERREKKERNDDLKAEEAFEWDREETLGTSDGTQDS